VLIDAAAYYVALLQAFRQARARIMILGWDFDPRMRLDPADPATSCAGSSMPWSRGVPISTSTC
jgi:hypothetical protein